MNDHEDYQGLAAGYALHALEPEDEQRLAAHLLTCNNCARLVADTAELGASFAGFLPSETPPLGLRERILAAAAAQPRSSKAAASMVPIQEPVSFQEPAPSEAPPLLGEPSPAIASALPAPHSGGRSLHGRSQPSRAARLRLRSRVAVGALAAVVGIAVAVPTTLAIADGGKSSGSNTALQQWLLSPGAGVVTLKGSGSAGDTAAAKAVMTEQGIYLVADGLPANDTGKNVYVLWAANSNGVRAAVTTFDVHGKTPVALKETDLPFKRADIREVAVSLEPGDKAPAKPTDVVLSGTPA